MSRGRRLQPPHRQQRDRQVQRHDLGPGRARARQRLLVQQPRFIGLVGFLGGARRARSTATTAPGATRISSNRASTTSLRLNLDRRPGQLVEELRLGVNRLQVDHWHSSPGAISKARGTGARPSSSGPPTRTNDWRQTYFGTKDNTKLWNGSGNWNDPSGNYTINYKNILTWIKSSPNVFPPQLRSGNILYYDSIPSDVPASAYDPHPARTPRSPTPTRGSGRSTSTTWSASGGIPAVTSSIPPIPR